MQPELHQTMPRRTVRIRGFAVYLKALFTAIERAASLRAPAAMCQMKWYMPL